MVRLLIKHNAATQYLNDQVSNERDENDKSGGDANGRDPFEKPLDASKTGKYTPLHWAAYKGHMRVVWILLKCQMLPSKEDMHGNNAVHQAAASGSVKVLKCFMSKGCDLFSENSR